MANKLNGIKKGEIVRIKFKSIQDITKNKNITQTLLELDEYDVGSNINALMLGGDFVVVSAELADKPETEASIQIHNHHDGGSFCIFNSIIDTIETITVANTFVSEDHGICMIQVEDKIYINGRILDNEQDNWGNSSDEKKLDKFVSFMEKYLVAKIFEDSISEEAPNTESK